jgi:hypothetical protein
MPFPKTAQSKGGKATASDYQKAIARETILRNEPWQKSTGPKTVEGQDAVTANIYCKQFLKFTRHFVSAEAYTVAKDAFFLKCRVLSERLKADHLGALNYTMTSTHEMGLPDVETVFRVSIRQPTPEGVEMLKKAFSDREWLK